MRLATSLASVAGIVGLVHAVPTFLNTTEVASAYYSNSTAPANRKTIIQLTIITEVVPCPIPFNQYVSANTQLTVQGAVVTVTNAPTQLVTVVMGTTTTTVTSTV